jgi:hypothetical protein
MADHMRDQILAAVNTALTGLTTTGSRVYLDQDNPLEDGELPGLTILQAGESTEVQTMPRPRLMQAVFDVDVSAYVKRTHAQGDARKTINTICKEVQIAMSTAALAGAKYATLVQTDFQLSGDAENPVAMATMRWQILYFYQENAPDVPQ